MIEKFGLEKSAQLNTVGAIAFFLGYNFFGAIAYENHEIGAIAESPWRECESTKNFFKNLTYIRA